VLSIEEMADAFAIDGLQPSPGVFDIQKLHWMNGVHIRALSREDLYQSVQQFDLQTTDEDYLALPARETLRGAFARLSTDYVAQALVLEQERVKLLSEFAEACEFFFTRDFPFDDAAAEKWREKGHVTRLFDIVIGQLEGKEVITHDECEAMVGAASDAVGLEKRGEAIHPIRLALTGRTKGPGLFDLMSLLGAEEMSERLKLAKHRF
jgi:glutamyl-tRNA synthetase